MAAKLSHNGFLSTSSSNPWLPKKAKRMHHSCKKVSELDRQCGNSRKRCFIRSVLLGNSNCALNFESIGHRKHYLASKRSRRMESLVPFASADDGVTVNGTPQASTSSDVAEMRVKLSQSLNTDGDGLVQLLHESARVFELAIKEQSPFSKLAWFSTAWLGFDRNAWVKALSYQASTYSLLQAAIEIASCSDGRDKDVNVFVQRSLLRQSACLESIIRDKLSARQSAYEWLWSEQVPKAVTSFVKYLEADPRFTAATSVSMKGLPMSSINSTDVSLLMLVLTCNATITKLGLAKVSCPQFFATIPEISGKLMDMLVEFVSIRQAYSSVKNIGFAREFFVHFGPRAAACRIKSDRDSEEVVFWVDLIQKQLQQAIDREKIWSRLTTSESIEVLERDLAIFGFFIALGRRTKSFLSANGFDVVDHPLEGFLRLLIGGSVLYYPQLSSISSYQMYVEVVCEELDWLPFYPGNDGSPKDSQGHGSKPQSPPDTETVLQVLDVCSHWMQSFIKHSKWLENHSNVKAEKFLSRGHNKLMECVEELGILKDTNMENFAGRIGPETNSPSENGSDSFDKALESVEEALTRLENLLQYMHVSSSNSGKEHIKAACSDLEKIRTLKKEAEFLEASFRAKADFLQQGVEPMSSEQQGNRKKSGNVQIDRTNRVAAKYLGLWSLFKSPSTRKPNPDLTLDESENELVGSNTNSESNEIHRFELLRSELKELEKRVQRSADLSENEEDVEFAHDNSNYLEGAGTTEMVQVQKKENLIEKSFDKLKETSTDVWQGTQLLAIDVAASSGLVRRALIGDELTEKEKQALQRTLTDLASVVPIGVLMLLPVTAVGHAAILAAIQRYVPALIPSTYGPERLDLLRQLEKVKELETDDEISDSSLEELARS